MRGTKLLTVPVLLVAGVAAAVALTLGTASPALANYGAAQLGCTSATWQFTNFPSNGKPNTVSASVKMNGATVGTASYTFTGGSSPTYTMSYASTGGSETIEAMASWDTNGVKGSYDSGPQTFNCAKPCVPVTVTITTPTPPVVTVTTPGATVTTPGQTATVTTPGKTRTVVKWRTRVVTHTVTVVRRVKTKPPTAKQKCERAIKAVGHTYVWKNGHCQVMGTG